MRPWCSAVMPRTWIAASVPVRGPWPHLTGWAERARCWPGLELARDYHAIALAQRLGASTRGQGTKVSAEFPELRASDADRDRVFAMAAARPGFSHITMIPAWLLVWLLPEPWLSSLPSEQAFYLRKYGGRKWVRTTDPSLVRRVLYR